MKLPAVELQTDDGKHEDCKEQKQSDLKQRDHGLHDGLQHDLQALRDGIRFYFAGSSVFAVSYIFSLSVQLKLDTDRKPSLHCFQI